jgi:hypothetical protein
MRKHISRMKKGRKSCKPLKQWCKARGIDPVEHMKQFPLLAGYYDLPSKPVIIQLSFWDKIRNFICRLLRVK